MFNSVGDFMVAVSVASVGVGGVMLMLALVAMVMILIRERPGQQEQLSRQDFALAGLMFGGAMVSGVFGVLVALAAFFANGI